jgi:hypothetical protein
MRCNIDTVYKLYAIKRLQTGVGAGVALKEIIAEALANCSVPAFSGAG